MIAAWSSATAWRSASAAALRCAPAVATSSMQPQDSLLSKMLTSPSAREGWGPGPLGRTPGSSREGAPPAREDSFERIPVQAIVRPGGVPGRSGRRHMTQPKGTPTLRVRGTCAAGHDVETEAAHGRTTWTGICPTPGCELTVTAARAPGEQPPVVSSAIGDAKIKRVRSYREQPGFKPGGDPSGVQTLEDKLPAAAGPPEGPREPSKSGTRPATPRGPRAPARSGPRVPPAKRPAPRAGFPGAIRPPIRPPGPPEEDLIGGVF
jgi:hypothetical protein